MHCPSCQITLPPDTTSCVRCRLAVRFAGGRFEPVYPEIRTGEGLYSIDLRNERPVGMQAGDFTLSGGAIRASQTPQGLLVDLDPGKAFDWSNPFVRMRDLCVRAAVTMLDAASMALVLLRCDDVGNARSQYGLMVSAARRAARLVRLIASPKENVFTGLTDWIQHGAIQPVGAPNDVELRAMGPMLEGRVQGQRVIALHDPVLGIGRAGIRFEAERGQSKGRVLWFGFETRAVLA